MKMSATSQLLSMTGQYLELEALHALHVTKNLRVQSSSVELWWFFYSLFIVLNEF
jgi:hypothetical protein